MKTPLDTIVPGSVLMEVLDERVRQHEKWGEQNHPDGTGLDPWDRMVARTAKGECDAAARDGRLTYRYILDEEVHEAFAERDPAKLRAELVQVAAVAVAWIEAIDRRTAEEIKRTALGEKSR